MASIMDPTPENLRRAFFMVVRAHMRQGHFEWLPSEAAESVARAYGVTAADVIVAAGTPVTQDN